MATIGTSLGAVDQQAGGSAPGRHASAGFAGPADRLVLFGSPRVHYAGAEAAEPLEWQKPVALLAYLGCCPGWHSRQAIAEVLRPDANSQAGKAYLRGLLHRTREIFPRLTGLEIEDGRLRWSGACDVQEFEQAMARGDWPAAVELQSSALLGSIGSTGEPTLDDWFREERLRLRQRLGSALIACIVQQRARDPQARADLMQKLVDLDPMDESAVQVLLTHAQSALERHTAATAYQTLKRRLAAEFGQEPLDTTQALHARLQGQAAVAEAPARASGPPGAGGAQLASQPIGRERELLELGELLGDSAIRLLTVYGPGGVGKTSVAKALHHSVSGWHGTDAIWVDLLSVDSVHGMLAAMAGQAAVVLHDGPLEDQLVHWLAARNALFFLDNFEQLSAHAGVLERLLRAAPRLRFVVTSREALGLPHEHLYALAGLASRGIGSPAAVLFERSAARVGHPVAEQELEDVCALVEHLDGLPLAIELAANWVTLLPVKAVLAELHRNPTFIDGAQPHGGSRTLQSVFEGMWSRLDAKEQEALLALSIMIGPIDLQTVRARADGEAGVFLRLVRKSLLQRGEGGLFRMHPLLRAFVHARSGERALRSARSRHAERIIGALVQLPALRLGHYLPEVVARMLPYGDDLAQAWRCAVDDGRWDLVAAALPNLAGFLMKVSRNELLIDLVADARARAPSDFPAAMGLAVAHAMASFRLGRMDEAEAMARAALEREPRLSAAGALLETVVSRVRRFYGDYDQALQHAQQAVRHLTAGDDVFARLEVVEGLALCHWHLGQLAEAEPWLLRNLALASRHDARYAEAMSLCLLGILRDGMGRSAEGLELLRSAERHFQSMHDPYRVAYCQRAMSFVYMKLGNTRQQVEMAQGALATFRAAGHEHEIAESLFAVVVAHDAEHRMAEAGQLCREALRRCLQTRQVPIALRCIAALGALETPEDRALGLAFMCFAERHPALRRGDTAFIDRRFRDIGATERELGQARDLAKAWTFDAVCDRLLGAGCRVP